jgi:formylglycine-generating enzyme
MKDDAPYVRVPEGFWLGQTPVTNESYARFRQAACGGNPSAPVVNVTWDEAAAYCEWAGGRLPSEAEWEYAAKAGSDQDLYGTLDELAWYADNSGNARIDSTALWTRDPVLENYEKLLIANGNGPKPVMQLKPNAWGLYDMLGNVWEWTSDSEGRERVMRGRSWFDLPEFVRISNRSTELGCFRFPYVGFRCLLPRGNMRESAS